MSESSSASRHVHAVVERRDDGIYVDGEFWAVSDFMIRDAGNEAENRAAEVAVLRDKLAAAESEQAKAEAGYAFLRAEADEQEVERLAKTFYDAETLYDEGGYGPDWVAHSDEFQERYRRGIRAVRADLRSRS